MFGFYVSVYCSVVVCYFWFADVVGCYLRWNVLIGVFRLVLVCFGGMYCIMFCGCVLGCWAVLISCLLG